jgi:gamma-glutamylaminecyclotransferase
MHFVFVYGTLKRGFPNFDAHMQAAKFLGPARTLDAYPLVIGGQWRTPFMIDEPGEGSPVSGEVFGVDDNTLALLDHLEGIGQPNGYHRAEITIDFLPAKRTMTAMAYLKHRNRIANIIEVLDGEYPFDPAYVVPSARG